MTIRAAKHFDGAMIRGDVFIPNISKRFERIYCTPDTTESDLEGRFVIVDGVTRWVDGPLVRALRHGKVLILHDFKRLNNRCAYYLFPILNASDQYTYIIQQTGEVLRDVSLIAMMT